MGSHFTVIYDACVLYPAPLRDLLMHLALSDLYRARWSDRIHDEWMRNVLASRPDLTQDFDEPQVDGIAQLEPFVRGHQEKRHIARLGKACTGGDDLAAVRPYRVLEQGEVFFGHDGFLFRDGCTLLELVADNEKETCQKVTSHLQPARAMFDARLVLLRFPRLALALGGPEFVQ